MINFLFGLSLPVAMLGIVAFMLYTFVRRPQVFAAATTLAIIAFGCVSLVLAAKLAAHGGDMLFVGGARYLLFAWCIMVVYFIAEWRYKIRLLGSILMPLALFLLLVASFEERSVGESVTLPAVPTVVHIILMFTFLALVVLAFAGSVMFLLKRRALKGHDQAALDHDLPALTTLTRLMDRPFRAGFPCITLGIALGILYAGTHLGEGWYLDEKILATLFIWFIYAGVFLWHAMGRLSNQALARGIILIFVLTVGSFFYSSHSDVLLTALRDRAPSEATTP